MTHYDFGVIQALRLKKMKKLLRKVNRYAETMRTLSDEDLAMKTQEFRQQLSKGASLDSLLPEAFAVVREVDYRVLGIFPYDVQVLGAIALHQGNLAEMKTGEGKTLTATMPLYLNALSGKGAFLVTTNEYLANRDGREMRPVFEFLGLTVGITDPTAKQAEKKAIYQSDIIYTTSAILGFDYLIDNLSVQKQQKFMRTFHYAIVDEADEVLLDLAQTPLVISGSPRVQSNNIMVASHFVDSLTAEQDYHYDEEENKVWLTTKGIKEAERFFDVENLFTQEHFDLTRQIILALKAHITYQNGKDYLVKDDKIYLLDSTNGRLLEGTRLQGGIHQAIEAKEQVSLSQEQRAMASITYQNLFQLFSKLSGMTGTAESAENEFIDIYGMMVIQIPTNLPVIRVDLPDRIFTTLPEKISAIIEQVKAIAQTGRPILLVTASVTMSELYSELLLLEEVPHNLLNAGTSAKEAQMISEAGKKGSVIVATNMAGRGTDIRLTAEAKALGGLYVIATEHMPSKRMDLQIRGRAGRQGEPGTSQFYVSLEDELLTKFVGDKIRRAVKKKLPKIDEQLPKELKGAKYRRWVTEAQETSEFVDKNTRLMTVEYGRSVQVQRQFIYDMRNSLLQGEFEAIDIMTKACAFAITSFFHDTKDITLNEANRFIYDHIAYDVKGFSDNKEMSAKMHQLVVLRLAEKKQFLHQYYAEFCRTVILKAIDESWIEEVDYLQQLRRLVSGQAINQRNPIFAYHQEAFSSYLKMQKDIAKKILHYAMLNDLSFDDKGDLVVAFI